MEAMKKMKNYFPEEVIVEILLRLPVKYLLRCKCLSKAWLSLISDPKFAKWHFDLASARTNRIIHISTFDEVRSIDFNASLHDDSAQVELPFPLEDDPTNLYIMGSCRGMILLLHDQDLYLWNPSTNVNQRISHFSRIEEDELESTLYGFGHDSSTDDYLVFQVYHVVDDYDDPTEETCIEFFSAKSNSWKEIQGNHLPYKIQIHKNRAGVLLNQAIHWYVLSEPDLGAVIISLNVKEKKLLEVPMPADFGHGRNCELGVLGKFLSLLNIGSNGGEIWLMREYGEKSSWTNSINVRESPGGRFSPICFTDAGGLIGTDGRKALMKYDHNGKMLENHQYGNTDSDEDTTNSDSESDLDDEFGHRRYCEAVLYSESLISVTLNQGEEGED